MALSLIHIFKMKSVSPIEKEESMRYNIKYCLDSFLVLSEKEPKRMGKLFL